MRPSLIISPHSGDGGAAAKPRKLSAPMKNTAYPVRSENSTSTLPSTLGRISRRAIEKADSPLSLALVTKSSVTTPRAAARTVRVTGHVKKKATVRMITRLLVSMEPRISRVRISPGRASMMSTPRMPTSSTQPRL